VNEAFLGDVFPDLPMSSGDGLDVGVISFEVPEPGRARVEEAHLPGGRVVVLFHVHMVVQTQVLVMFHADTAFSILFVDSLDDEFPGEFHWVNLRIGQEQRFVANAETVLSAFLFDAGLVLDDLFNCSKIRS
jgi:hypothetical protein